MFVAFLGITFVAWAPLIVYIQIVQPVRALFAWSFDQVIPEKVASINERTHTPVFTLALITVCSIPFLYMAAYTTNFFKVVALSTIVGFPTFVLVGISAILFPYRRKAAYEASVSNISLLGVPLLVYFGIGSILAGLFGGWLWFAYPTLGLPRAGDSLVAQLFTSPFRGGLALVAACLIVGACIYYVGKAVAGVAGDRPVAQLPRDPTGIAAWGFSGARRRRAAMPPSASTTPPTSTAPRCCGRSS